MSVRMMSEGDTIVLIGDFDGRCTEELRDTLHLHLARTGGVAEVDMSRVESIDITALRVLLVVAHYAHEHGGRMSLTHCTPQLRRTLSISGLIRLVERERVVQAS